LGYGLQQVRPRTIVLDGVEIPMQGGNFEGWGKRQPIAKYRDRLCAVSCAKTAEPIDMSFGMCTRVCSGKHMFDGGAHWRNLANRTESSMCSVHTAIPRCTAGARVRAAGKRNRNCVSRTFPLCLRPRTVMPSVRRQSILLGL